ncbi:MULTISPECIES: CU044_5270 family protein [unclassified Nocardiopsis]|uniref:CU044_5270 family protein n=1 Tax=Nocardiopsis TaxID=2013 RepID=UPI00387B69B5
MDDLTALRTALTGADPAAGTAPAPEARHRARTHAIARLEETPAVSRPLWRRIPVLAAGAAAAAVAVGAGALLLPADEPGGIPAAYAAPPEPIEVVGGDPVDGADDLLALAEVTEGRGPAAGSGDVGFVSTSGTTLFRLTANAGDEDPDETHGYRYVPYEWNVWTGPDGAHREDSHPQPPLDKGGEEADHEWFLERGTESFEDTLHPSLVWPAELPTDPDGMADVLADLGEGPLDGSPSGIVNAMEFLYGTRPLAGPEEAAVQRVLAGLDGLEYLGTATDPLGREGELFSVEVEDEMTVSEFRFLFDAGDGSLLYRDTTLLAEDPELGSAGDYGLAYPLTTEQVGYVWSGWVGEVGARP